MYLAALCSKISCNIVFLKWNVVMYGVPSIEWRWQSAASWGAMPTKGLALVIVFKNKLLKEKLLFHWSISP